VIQNLHPYTAATPLEGVKQTIAQGPVASQEAIKQLGTNGGGFFNAKLFPPVRESDAVRESAPDVSDFSDPWRPDVYVRQRWCAIHAGLGRLAAMAILWFAGVLTAYHFEQKGTPMLAKAGIETTATDTQPGGNMEGKETRFRLSPIPHYLQPLRPMPVCGAVNSMHDSFNTPR